MNQDPKHCRTMSFPAPGAILCATPCVSQEHFSASQENFTFTSDISEFSETSAPMQCFGQCFDH